MCTRGDVYGGQSGLGQITMLHMRKDKPGMRWSGGVAGVNPVCMLGGQHMKERLGRPQGIQ